MSWAPAEPATLRDAGLLASVYTGSTTDERAVRSHMTMKGFNGRCSQCGALNRFTSVLSYNVGVNPLEATRADKGAPVPGDQAETGK